MEALHALIMRLYPGATVGEIETLGDDEAPGDATRKGIGYGVPVRIRLLDAGGRARCLVFHTARADDFGHDRRADRAQEMLLAYDTFGQVPRHVPAVDVGVIGPDGTMRSIADAGELYLLTEWAEGEPYANDLRRIARQGVTARDLDRADQLSDYLVGLHTRLGDRPAIYTRAVRDLVGSGEGLFGIVDSYGAEVPSASPARLQRIEQLMLDWRWRLRGLERRLSRTHGDFHPFNIVFGGDDTLVLLDASRGCAGDPADDLAALAVNYVFFALDAPGTWRSGFGALWHRLWSRYIEASGDCEVLEVAAPWLAWRALVVANPRWYPGSSARGRDALLGWIEDLLAAPRLDPSVGRWSGAMTGAVVWLTGLPASGKSTLAARLADRLASARIPTLTLDSDEIRDALEPSPTFDDLGRDGFYTTLARLACLAARQGLVAIVAATAHRQRWRDWRGRAHLDSSKSTSRRRSTSAGAAIRRASTRRSDAAGLLPGVGVRYEPPLAPDVIAPHGDDSMAVDAVLAHLGVS